MFSVFGAISPISGYADSALKETIKAADREPMPNWQLPKIEKRELWPQVKLWVLEDRKLPTAELFFLLPYGTLADSDDQVGRLQILAKAWRQGGTARYSPAEFAKVLESRSIGLNVEVGPEMTIVSLSALKADLPFALDLFSEWWKSPRFDADRIALIEKGMAQALRQLPDYPDSLAAYFYPELLYGRKSPWGRALKLHHIPAISRAHLEAAYRSLTSVQPLWIGASGAVDRAVLEKYLRPFFKREGEQHEPPQVPLMKEKRWTPGVTWVAQEGDQSTIMLGHLGDRRFVKDKFSLLLADFLLGGDTFSSVLGQNLRAKEGLVYGIYSNYGLGSDYGVFRIVANTKARETARVLDAMKAAMRRVMEGKGISESALHLAKNAFLSELLMSNLRKGDLMKTLLRFDYYGYPPDYLEKFGKEIAKVTLADVVRVANAYWFPDRLVVLVVGPKSLANHLGSWKPTRILKAEELYQ